MQTLLDILRKAGGWHPGLSLTIANPPYPELFIEATDESGPCGLYALSAAQYGNALATPEMHFELSFAGGVNLNPFYYRNDYLGIDECSRFIANGHYVYDAVLHRRHGERAKQWDDELRSQHVVDAFEANSRVRV